MTRRPFGQVYARGAAWIGRYRNRVNPLSRTSPPAPGPKWVVRSFPSEKKAKDWLKGIRDAALLGCYRPAGERPAEPEVRGDVLTVSGALDAYGQAKRGEGLSAASLRQLAAVRGRVAASPLGARDVREVTPQDLEAFLLWRQERLWRTHRETGEKATAPVKVELRADERKPSSSTVARDFAWIAAALNRLARLGVIPENPARRVRKPKETKRARVALSKEEALALVRACAGDLRVLVLVALLTGGRRGEVLALRWGDVNFQSGTVTLSRSKVRNASTLPLHPALAEELRLLRARRAEKYHVPGNEERIFPDAEFRKGWRDALAAAGLAGKKGLTFHSLRHSFATHFLEGGGAITDLAGVLGHASVTTTMIYAKMVDARTRDTLFRMDLGVGAPAPVHSQAAAPREVKPTNIPPQGRKTGTDGVPVMVGGNVQPPEAQEVAGGAPCRTRTCDPVIKSHLLYQLS